MKPEIYPSTAHHIRNEQVNPNALTVLRRLHEAGFEAYLVGGSVRDLLLHKKPKDFDITTEARPEEVKRLFGRQALLIGRRFRLVHVRFGPEVIEVATFRAGDSLDETLITRDNIYGNAEEDVYRRDFTFNGLFYDPQDHRIIDYVGGFKDLQNNFLRVIGDPILRFRQDPVRMIRMQKFCARFGFQVQTEALEAMESLRGELRKSSPARIIEEILRMLQSSAASPFFSLLYESKLLEILMPHLASLFEEKAMRESICDWLKMADEMNHRGHYKPLDRSILFAALVYPLLEREIDEKMKENPNRIPHLGEIFNMTMNHVNQIGLDHFLAFPKKLRHDTTFILEMQYRLTPLEKRRHLKERLARHPDFILPLTFLKLRALRDPHLFKTYELWKSLWKEFGNKEYEP